MTKAHKPRLQASQACKQTGLIVIGSGAVSSGCRRAVVFQNVLGSLHNLPALKRNNGKAVQVLQGG